MSHWIEVYFNTNLDRLLERLVSGLRREIEALLHTSDSEPEPDASDSESSDLIED